MTSNERDKFDRLLDQVLRDLPMSVRELFDEAPIIIEDRPSRDLLEDLDLDPDDDSLCGLYTGTPITARSVDGEAPAPDYIHIFREGIIQTAGGWEQTIDADGRADGGEAAIVREIRITILHELGHRFGLDEHDLEMMGYD